MTQDHEKKRLQEFQRRIIQQGEHLINAGYEFTAIGGFLSVIRESDGSPLTVEFTMDFPNEETPNADS